MRQMTGKIESEPGMAKPAKRQAVDIGYCDDQPSSRSQKSARLRKYIQRIVDVFQRMPHGDDIKRCRLKLRMRQSSHVSSEVQFATNALHGGLGQIDARHIPAMCMHPCQIGAGPAAEIEQASLSMPAGNIVLFS